MVIERGERKRRGEEGRRGGGGGEGHDCRIRQEEVRTDQGEKRRGIKRVNDGEE